MFTPLNFEEPFNRGAMPYAIMNKPNEPNELNKPNNHNHHNELNNLNDLL